MPVDINAIDFSGTDIGQEAPAGPDFSGTGLEDVDFSGTELEQELPERSALRAADRTKYVIVITAMTLRRSMQRSLKIVHHSGSSKENVHDACICTQIHLDRDGQVQDRPGLRCYNSCNERVVSGWECGGDACTFHYSNCALRRHYDIKSEREHSD